MSRNQRKRIPQESKVRAHLQQEINSTCPICSNRDVGHFQIHHIDENPQNNIFSNLILICPTCHSKVTKKDISQQDVIEIKSRLPNVRIEFISAKIDSKSCSWIPYDNAPFAFINERNSNSPFPVLDFSFVNLSKQTIVLTAIKIKAKHLYSGLSGIPMPKILRSSHRYKIPIPNNDDEEMTHVIDEQLEIPADRAFRFQIQLYMEDLHQSKYEIDGRKVLYFTFVFGNIFLKIPAIFLNCKSENEKLQIYILS